MKKILNIATNNIVRLLSLVLLFVVLSGCQEKFEMIPPPSIDDPDYEEPTAGIFVKKDGIGQGTSWDDALSGDEFIAKLKNGYAPADTIYVAAGIYYTGTTSTDVLSLTQDVKIKGGYAPDITGYDVSISYPSEYETIFSGDLNGNDIADNGDCRVLELKTVCTVSFTGITFTNGYVNAGANRPGIQADGGSTLYLDYCKVINNITEVNTPVGDAGGAGIYILNATVNCSNTIIANNFSENRGGAIRMSNDNGVLELNSCLVHNNAILTGSFGGAIQLSANGSKLYCINSTITGNKAPSGGAGINGGGHVYLISSTVVDNYCDDGSAGHDMRIESLNKVFFLNSIVTGSSSRINSNNPNVLINGANFNITSIGNNYIGTVAGSGSFAPHVSDNINKYYVDIFGTNKLADNGGFSQTIALKSYLYGAPLLTMFTYVSANVPYGDINVDQNGVERKDPATVGAHEYQE